jgi:HSF-type DNA-binding
MSKDTDANKTSSQSSNDPTDRVQFEEDVTSERDHHHTVPLIYSNRIEPNCHQRDMTLSLMLAPATNQKIRMQQRMHSREPQIQLQPPSQAFLRLDSHHPTSRCQPTIHFNQSNSDPFSRLIQFMLDQDESVAESSSSLLFGSNQQTLYDDILMQNNEAQKQLPQKQEKLASTTTNKSERMKIKRKLNMLFQPYEEDIISSDSDTMLSHQNGILNRTSRSKKTTTTINRSHPPYHDFSNITEHELNKIKNIETIGNSKESFPVILHNLLEHVEFNVPNYKDIIHWNDHGRSFVIVNKNLFTSRILPYYFHGQKHYASFHRQLNCYGFLRIRKADSMDRNSFYHAMFLRGRHDLVHYLPRIRCHQNHVRVSLDPDTEPDFSNYPPVTGRNANAATVAALPTSSLSTMQEIKYPAIPVPFLYETGQKATCLHSRFNHVLLGKDVSSHFSTAVATTTSEVSPMSHNTNKRVKKQKNNQLMCRAINKSNLTASRYSCTIDTSLQNDNDDDTYIKKCTDQMNPKIIKIIPSLSKKDKIHVNNDDHDDDELSLASSTTINSDLAEFLSDVDL